MKKLVDFNSLKRIFGFKQGIKSASDLQENYIIDGNALSDKQVEFDTSSSSSKIIACVLFSFFAVIFQEAFFNDFRILGAKPDIALVVVIIISTLSAPRFSMLYGLFTGLYIDIIYGKYLGLYALLFMYIAIIASVAVAAKIKGKSLYTGLILVPVLLLYCIVEGFFARLLTIYSAEYTTLYYDFGSHFMSRILSEFLYDSIVLAILIIPITLLWRNLAKRKKEIKWKG